MTSRHSVYQTLLWCLMLASATAFASDDRAVTIEEEQTRAERLEGPPGAPSVEATAAAASADASLTTDNQPTSEGAEPTSPATATADSAAADSTAAIAGSAEADNLPTAESINLSDVVEQAQPTPPVAASSAPEATQSVPEQKEQPRSPLVLLGARVPAGTATRLAWSPAESFAGIASSTPVLVVHGRNPGPTLCLTGAVHGDELNGVEIVRRVMYELEPDKLAGTVIGVPIVNLQGFRRASRYLPDRRDLNRYFPGYAAGSSASRIAHSFFNEVVSHCDFLVDLHTGSFRRTNLPQLRADLKNSEVAELVEHLGAIVVLQSRGAQGSLRRAAVEHGIPAVTLEAGEPHSVQKDSVNEGVKCIETLLHKRNMYPQRGIWARSTEPVFYKSLWVRAPKGGILVSQILLGEKVQKGDTLGTVTDPITNQATAINSPIRGRVIGMAINQVMLPGYAAYHIGYQSTLEEAAEGDVGPDDTAGDEASDEPPLGASTKVDEAVLDAE